MLGFRLEQALAACKGQFHGDASLLQKMVRGVVIDNRKVERDFLFVPIRGERFDGHDFIHAAMAAGALCCLTEKRLEESLYIIVENTERALQDIAAFYKSLFTLKTFGVTGSAGKTTTKELIACVLEQQYNVLKTEGNFNNQTGVPQTLFRLLPGHEVAVIEMGMNHIGEIDRLAEMVKPDYCVLTNIGTAHIEHFGSHEGILRAKSEMLPHMNAGGKVFVNGDDELLYGLKDERNDLITYGVEEHNDVCAINIVEQGLDGTNFTVVHAGGSFAAHVPAPGLHMVVNALAAVAAGLELKMEPARIAAGIASYVPVGGRMKIHRTGKITILDDVYNANPQSVAAALDTLRLAGRGRRVCILGDMLELGEDAAQYHINAGKHAAVSCELALFTGTWANDMCRGAHSAGCETQHFETKEELVAMLPALIQEGDTVLVKASRGMRLEEVVQALLEDGDVPAGMSRTDETLD